MSMRTAKETRSGKATYGFRDDDNTGLHSDAADTVQLLAGGTEIAEFSASAKPVVMVPLAVAGASGSSGVFASAANPFGADVLITGLYVRITTQSTGASTLDIGIGANATTSNDGLIDGLSGAAAGLFTNFEDAGTNGEVSMVWGSSQFLNVAEASGDVDALVATVYAACVRI